MKEVVSITGLSSISPLGINQEEAKKQYQQETHCFSKKKVGASSEWVAQLSAEGKKEIEKIPNSNDKYKKLDPTVWYAIYAARNSVKMAGWERDIPFGINIGSSRGATTLFEKFHESFLKNEKSTTLASPTTTLGNISSWVADDLQNDGVTISHSITCATGLHSLLNGVAWIKSGMTSRFLVGASEAPLTDFTIAQMKALRIYSQQHDNYPCRPLDFSKKSNTMILGEAASMACLEAGRSGNALAFIEGVGYATEILKHNTSISTNADCFQKSMKMALDSADCREVDLVIMHAPGTVKGDVAEMNAIKQVFGNNPPAVCSNKWKIGHTFATSGMMNLELAILLFQNPELIKMPYLASQKIPNQIKNILVNAVGFGGNAVSILITANK